MVESHASKYPPSEYQTGEEVMIKTPFTGKKIKGKKKLIFKGRILERNGNRYKIEYQKSGKLDLHRVLGFIHNTLFFISNSIFELSLELLSH